jgi:hypothetical protein
VIIASCYGVIDVHTRYASTPLSHTRLAHTHTHTYIHIYTHSHIRTRIFTFSCMLVLRSTLLVLFFASLALLILSSARRCTTDPATWWLWLARSWRPALSRFSSTLRPRWLPSGLDPRRGPFVLIWHQWVSAYMCARVCVYVCVHVRGTTMQVVIHHCELQYSVHCDLKIIILWQSVANYSLLSILMCSANPIGLAIVQVLTPYIVNSAGDIERMVSSTPSPTPSPFL